MVEIATLQDIERLLEKQKLEIVEAILANLKGSEIKNTSQWLRTRQVKDMLNVSDATLHNYRIDGILNSQKIRGSHFYAKADVLKLMEKKK